MRSQAKQNIATLIAFVIASVAVVGYFVGLQAPMHTINTVKTSPGRDASSESKHRLEGQTILATGYSDMATATGKRSRVMQTSLAELKSSIDSVSDIEITHEQKQNALSYRAENRAFNGAPPTIPHPVDQKSTAACIACHGDGVKTQSLRIPRMSHAFLANCTQCHIESAPQHMAAELFRGNDFAGLPAPSGGPRAFAGAPPQIPHSTWMRSDCLSCHGFTGAHGLRTTHPWRTSCQQCHAPSATMDQTLLLAEPEFLPPPSLAQ